MQKSKIYFIQVDKKINEQKLNDFFKEMYEINKQNHLFINTYLENEDLYSKGKYYECWSFEDSFFKLDNQNYLLKLNSSYSPNDIAGNFKIYDSTLNVIALDLNIDEKTYLPLGMKFSNLENSEYEANNFIKSIYGYRDINKGNFFYKTKKQELIDLIKNNNINLSNFSKEILDQIDEFYFSNKNFDSNASVETNEEFQKIFLIANKDYRSTILRFY